MDADKKRMEKKTRWVLHKNVTCCFELILEATHHKSSCTATCLSKTINVRRIRQAEHYWRRKNELAKYKRHFFYYLLHMVALVLTDKQEFVFSLEELPGVIAENGRIERFSLVFMACQPLWVIQYQIHFYTYKQFYFKHFSLA